MLRGESAGFYEVAACWGHEAGLHEGLLVVRWEMLTLVVSDGVFAGRDRVGFWASYMS